MTKENADSEEQETNVVLLNNKMTASSNLGVTQEYTGNRSELWDSTKSKRKFRDEVFGEKKTIRDASGNILHKDHKAAKNKYHQKDSKGNNNSTKWAKHAAEVDHKVSLESLHSHAKHNPFLKDSDLKEIANSKENYQILSKSQNASKGSDISADLKTHVSLHGKFAVKTISNASGEFVQGMKENIESSALSIIADSLNKLFVEGESLEDTVESAVKSLTAVAITGGAEKLLIDTATHLFANSGNQVLQSIVEFNGIGQLVVLGAAVGKSLIKYIDGEISSSELAEEIRITGITMVVSTIASIAIPIPLLAPIISCIAINAVNLIYQTNKSLDDYLLKEETIKKLEHQALAEMEYQRNKFRDIVQKEHDNWDKTTEEAFNQIIYNSFDDNFSLEKMVDGLDKILLLFGEKAKFHSVSEWEEQLELPLELSF